MEEASRDKVNALSIGGHVKTIKITDEQFGKPLDDGDFKVFKHLDESSLTFPQQATSLFQRRSFSRRVSTTLLISNHPTFYFKNFDLSSAFTKSFFNILVNVAKFNNRLFKKIFLYK